MAKKYKIITIIVLVLILGFSAYWFLGNKKPAAQPSQQTTPATTSTSEFKIYKNNEFGFEFQYPSDLILKEKVFGSYYSKFNLEIFLQKRGLDSVFLLNVVVPKFVENNFWESQENTSKVVVGGVEGTKYQYEFEGYPQTVVILPFGELKMILGTGDGSKQYLEEFNQILSTFKFLK